MRRMIIQNSFINEQQIAVEALDAKIEIDDYKIERVGNQVFGCIKLTASGALETTKLFKISGAPKTYGSFAIRITFCDGESAASGAVLGYNVADGIVAYGRIPAGSKYDCTFTYIIGGNE